jgi:CRP-like cAMP-binding protein
MEIIGLRLARIEADHYRARFHLADARLASALLEMAGEGAAIVGPSHAEIGREVGLFRETVTNKLNLMKAAGLVKLGRRQVTILDKRALRELSEL